MFEKYMVSIDFSEHSLEALRWTQYLAKKTNGKIVLLHVIPETNISFSDAISPEFIEQLGEKQTQHAQEKLEELATNIRSQGIKCDVEVSYGSPHQEILRVARKKKVDVITMGTRGLSGIERFFLGSVTARVLRGADIPVLVTRTKRRPIIRKILVPTDTSKTSYKGFQFAVKLSEHLNVKKIYLLYCLETLGAVIPQKILKVLQEEFINRLRKAQKKSSVPVEERVIPASDAADGISEFASSEKVDLIVMASHGRTGVGRILLGSTVEKVIRKTPVPVLIIKVGRKK